MHAIRLTLALLLAAAPAFAADGPETPRHTVIELAPGVYAVIRPWLRDAVSDSNVLVVINDADVVVVDAGILPSAARAVIAEIKRLTPLPVRYVINTHWHSDHHYGNQAYRDAWPAVEFVQHRRTRELVLSEDVPGLRKNLAVEYPALAERFRKALATGKRSNGEPVTEEQRVQFTNTLAIYESFIEEMGKTPIIPATLTVEDRWVLHRGERTIEVRFLGRGNTPGDLVVHLPKERVVATGDLVVHPIPFAFFSYLGEWPTTLRELAKLDAAAILPGHGELQRDWRYVERLAALIESTWTQVKAAVAAGKDLEATYAAVNLEAFLPEFGGEASRGQFDSLYRRPAVESAFNELTARTPKP
jgi:glyoxylase-like metal-dependent hydrolase (beta-lactamase superfamily II)